MKCKDIETLLPDYLAGQLDSVRKKELESHLAACSVCREEYENISVLWGKLDKLPFEEPGGNSRDRFDAMLSAYAHGLGEQRKQVGFFTRIDAALGHIIPSRPVFQAAAAVIFIVLGFLSGRTVQSGKYAEQEVDRLRTEMGEMRELLTVSLMNQPSALDRLQGVTMSRQLAATDDDILSALIKTLNTDPSEGVRLAAIDALGSYRDRDWVRSELVSSLARRQPPHVQVSLINLLSDMKEGKAKDIFQALVDDENTMDVVKKHARKGLQDLI